MWRAGHLPESSARPSAIEAYHSSKVISTNYMSAPSGASIGGILEVMDMLQ